MFKYLKKQWNYLVAKLTGRFDEKADPKVQLEQAIAEAQNQHKRLKEQAANVIGPDRMADVIASLRQDSPRYGSRSLDPATAWEAATWTDWLDAVDELGRLRLEKDTQIAHDPTVRGGDVHRAFARHGFDATQVRTDRRHR